MSQWTKGSARRLYDADKRLAEGDALCQLSRSGVKLCAMVKTVRADRGTERYGLQDAEYETLEASLSALLQTMEEEEKKVGE